MKFKSLSIYQVSNSRMNYDIKKATNGFSYEEINKNELLNGFLVTLIGAKLLK